MKIVLPILLSSLVLLSCTDKATTRAASSGKKSAASSDSKKSSGSSDSSSTEVKKAKVVKSDVPMTSELPEGAVSFYYLDPDDTGICYDYRFDKEAAEDPEKVGDSVKEGTCPASIQVDGAEVKPMLTCPYLRIEDDGLNLGLILYSRGVAEEKSYSRNSSDAETSCRRWQVLGHL